MKLAVAALLFSVTFAASPFAFGEVANEAERLERLERAVELLQKRNVELEAEVRSLKKEKSPAPKSPAPLVDEKRSHFTPDSKATVVEKSEKTEEKQPVYVVPGGSEYKRTLGGYIQANLEAGDVSAFEG